MYHLVYTSLAKYPFGEEELRELLKVSRDKNLQLSVTGLLLYANRKFMQALEGEQETVMSLYEKIKMDPRHELVRMIVEGNSDNRLFEKWSMGFKSLSEEDLNELKGFEDTHRFFMDNSPLHNPKLVLTLLEMFYKKNWVDFPEVAF